MIDQLWEITMKYGFNVRNNNLNGLEYWNKLKNILVQYNIELEWIPEAISRYNYMIDEFNIKDIEMNDELKDIMSKDIDTKKLLWEQTHFFLQHSRIPKNNEKSCNLIRLMQIAYNAGQFYAERKKNAYSQKITNWYDLSHLRTYISYVTPKSIQIANDKLVETHQLFLSINSLLLNQKGGTVNYMYKYKKYLKKLCNFL